MPDILSITQVLARTWSSAYATLATATTTRQILLHASLALLLPYGYVASYLTLLA